MAEFPVAPGNVALEQNFRTQRRYDRHRAIMQLIARMRDAAGMTQGELAAAFGRDPDFIVGIECGDSPIDVLDHLALGDIHEFDSTAVPMS